MSSFKIRLYEESDYYQARKLVSSIVMELANTAFVQLIRQPHMWPPLLALLFLPVIEFVPPAASTLSVAFIILWLWFGCWYMFSTYVRSTLSEDMLDIQTYYLDRDGYCFWVAESEQKVVGTVGIAQSSLPGREHDMEMRRLVVSKNYRRLGIAEELCKTAVDFARKRGCKAVITATTSAQPAAHQLYEKLGFKLIHKYYREQFLRMLLDVKTLLYQYEFPQSP